jgi:hypothetical protein
MPADFSGLSSPSSAANRIVSVTDDSVDTEGGFPSFAPPLATLEPCAGPMFVVVPSARLALRDGGSLRIRGRPSLCGEGLTSPWLDPPGGVLILRILSLDPPNCTREVALTKGDCPSLLMAVGLGATGRPVFGILFSGF